MVNLYWKDEYNDLDMTTRKFRIGEAGANDEEKAGYEILRDNERNFLAELAVEKNDDPNYTDPNRWYWGSGTCGVYNNQMPYRMKRSGENGVGRVFMLPEGTRIRGAGPAWGLAALNGTNRESKRHAFAIRTCSGCHSQEGATRGFHVTPRLPNQSAKLSAFLTGNRERFQDILANPAQSNEFTFGSSGKTYSYNELYFRTKWLSGVLKGEAVLYDSLKRPELAK